MHEGLEVLCGLWLDGARLTAAEDLPAGSARIGLATLGPTRLLADLELRLGLAPIEAAQAVRVARWSKHVAKFSATGRFYSRSHEADGWGTAAELLRWRDALVEAGWDGAAIAGGGDRMDQLHEIEEAAQSSNTPLPPSMGDRVRVVEAELRRQPRLVYSKLHCAEPLALWPLRWQRIFSMLAGSGCEVEELRFTPLLADEKTDLGRVQRQILDGSNEPVQPSGDGSLILLRGETPWETAHAVSGLLRSWADAGERIVVIREGDPVPLERAQGHVGLPTQGVASASRLRPFLQALPLALELVFEPKDPYRVLELLALPDGPFRGSVGRRLADALAGMPGIGSELWEKAKQEIADRTRERALAVALAAGRAQDAAASYAEEAAKKRLLRVAEWIEAQGQPQDGAPRAALIDAVSRVQAWLRGRIAIDGAVEHSASADVIAMLAAAHRDAAALAEALTADSRVTWTIEQMRQLVDVVLGAGVRVDLHDEEVGRVDHVDRPAALLRVRETVVWWGCTAESAGAPRTLPFTRVEREALHAAGIRIVESRLQMAEAGNSWRRAVLVATKRLVLVAPRSAGGEEVAVHPLWDELCARIGGERRILARISVDAREVLGNSSAVVGAHVATTPLEALRLPEPRPAWQLPARHRTADGRMSATSIETLLGCPLRWVLDYRAGVRNGSLVSLPKENLLYGRLGHRLIELLHKDGAFSLEPDELLVSAGAKLDAILPREGAPLLLPGRHSELTQLRRRLADAVVRLADMLRQSKLEIVEVERAEQVEWRGRELVGRLDLLLADRRKADVVLDLKWGRKTYVDGLKEGVAVQLAVYAYLRKKSSGAKGFPAAAYFSLKRGEALAVDDSAFAGATVVAGPDAESTWKRTDVTVRLVEQHLETGNVPVAGVGGGTLVVEACGGAVDTDKHLVLAPEAACGYCEHGPVCGRQWESLR